MLQFDGIVNKSQCPSTKINAYISGCYSPGTK